MKLSFVVNETRKLVQKKVDDLSKTDEIKLHWHRNQFEYEVMVNEIVLKHNSIYDTETYKVSMDEYESRGWGGLVKNHPFISETFKEGPNRAVIINEKQQVLIETLFGVEWVSVFPIVALWCTKKERYYHNYEQQFDFERSGNSFLGLQSQSREGKKESRSTNSSETRGQRLENRDTKSNSVVNLEMGFGSDIMQPTMFDTVDSKIENTLLDSTNGNQESNVGKKTIDMNDFKQGISSTRYRTSVKISDCGALGFKGIPKQSGKLHYYYSNGEVSRDGYDVISLRRNGYQLLMVLEGTSEEMGLDKKDITRNHDNPYLPLKKDGNISKSRKSHSILQNLGYKVQSKFRSKGSEESIEYPAEIVDAGMRMGILVDLSKPLS